MQTLVARQQTPQRLFGDRLPAALRRDPAGGVLGVRVDAQGQHGLVSFGCVQQELGQFGGLVDAAHQHAYGKRVERAGVPDFRGAQHAFDPCDHPGRRKGCRLVDHQDAAHGMIVRPSPVGRSPVPDGRRQAVRGVSGNRRVAAHSFSDHRINSVLMSAGVDSTWNPAALKWPPPPKAPAIAATSTVPSDLRLT